MKKQNFVTRALIGGALAAAAGVAQAHTGHAASNFFEAVAHLVGGDHLMAAGSVAAMALFGWVLVRAMRRR